MPRTARIDIPQTVYHIYTRGHNKSPLFLDDLDRKTFLKHLQRATREHPWELLGYCLMGNHYHLQVKTFDIPLAKTMHLLNTLYAEYFNFRYRRAGHAFQNRFHSIPVEMDSYLVALSRYIHLNPVKAGIVTHPEDYPWSSYRELVGLCPAKYVSPLLILSTLDQCLETQRSTYRRFVEDGIESPSQFTDEKIGKTRIYGSLAFIQSLREKAPHSFVGSAGRSEK